MFDGDDDNGNYDYGNNYNIWEEMMSKAWL